MRRCGTAFGKRVIVHEGFRHARLVHNMHVTMAEIGCVTYVLLGFVVVKNHAWVAEVVVLVPCAK